MKSVLVLLASVLGCEAATNNSDSFKEFLSHPPTNLVIRAIDEKTIIGLSSDIVMTNQRGAVTHITPKTAYNLQLVRSPGNASLIRSSQALNLGFQRNANFSGKGIATNTPWDLNPAGQIHYTIDAKQPALDMTGFGDIENVLTFGVPAKLGSFQWSGNAFKAIIKPDLASKNSRAPEEVTGELIESNGLPASLSYRVEKRLYGMVTYTYNKGEQGLLPDEIDADRYTINGTNMSHVINERIHIAEVRQTLEPEDTLLFDPLYYLKLGQAQIPGEQLGQTTPAGVFEDQYLTSNKMTVASINKKGQWVYHRVPRGPNRSIYAAMIVFALICGPALFIYLRKRPVH